MSYAASETKVKHVNNVAHVDPAANDSERGVGTRIRVMEPRNVAGRPPSLSEIRAGQTFRADPVE